MGAGGEQAGHVLITGGTGYIGARLVETCLERGMFVTVLARAFGSHHPRLRHYAWRLGEPMPEGAFGFHSGQDGSTDGFPPLNAVLHVAHDWADSVEGDANVNVAGSVLVLEAARERGLRVVFCSSVSARQGAMNRYGRVKWAVETLLDSPREVAARIGLVYGGPAKGLWGTMLRITNLVPVLPMLESSKPIQPIHLDEVCDGLIRLAWLECPQRKIFGLAAQNPISFGNYLALVARHRHARRLWLVNIPLGLALAGVTMAAKLPGLPKIDRERILGLAGLPVIDTADSLAELGLNLLPIEQGLQPEPWRHRRAMIEEGRILLHYILGRPAPLWAIRRYVRGVVSNGGFAPLGLPSLASRGPGLVRLIEPVGGDGALARRLYLASLVAEATPAGAEIFHDYSGRSRLAVFGRLMVTGLIEAACMPVRLTLGRRWR